MIMKFIELVLEKIILRYGQKRIVDGTYKNMKINLHSMKSRLGRII